MTLQTAYELRDAAAVYLAEKGDTVGANELRALPSLFIRGAPHVWLTAFAGLPYRFRQRLFKIFGTAMDDMLQAQYAGAPTCPVIPIKRGA